jgi:hypothetical protein
MQTAWFVALISTICFEGLGRRYLPFVPPAAFYFLKDAVLLWGYFQFRVDQSVRQSVRFLLRGFEGICLVGILWTIAEIFNPEHQSFILGLIGLQAYWLWWIAPPVIASVLQRRKEKDRAIYALFAVSLVVAVFAAIQFASPADSSVNMYSVWNGEEVYAADSATIQTTGRARVASTFAYISGFTDFTILVPALLLSLGLDAENSSVRRAALLGAMATAIVVPMSGSRSAVVIGGGLLLLSLWTAGLFFTRIGRRILVGSAAAAVLMVVLSPDAVLGLQDRFQDTSETSGRFEGLATLLPPVALATFDYPPLGIGTGMEHNARAPFHVETKWDVESELGRYLVELGPIGFVLVWTARLGLMVGLLRAYGLLKRSGRRGSAAAALSFAAVTMIGSLTFDHNWQALYFMGYGFVLAEVVSVRQKAAAMRDGSFSASNPASLDRDEQALVA